jgi:hypothetical protein
MILDPKTRTIRCTYYFSNDDRCLHEATHFFRITTPRSTLYDAKCDLHYKQVAIVSRGRGTDRIEEIDSGTFIIEPVMES